MRAGCKIWLYTSHGKAFGQGPLDLLRRVEKTSSLHQAAQQMGMSYNKAWKLVQMIEEHLGFSLLEKKVGGVSGGGSRVTPRAKDFLKRYERFEADAIGAVEKAYQKHFENPLREKRGR